MKVNHNWWKEIFDDIYLITDARSVCNNELTRKEVDFVELYLNPGKDDNILDLCGGEGRHSLEMAARGYCKLTVLDFSGFLIKRGKERAKEKGYNISFMLGDARHIGLKTDQFHYVILMANSFGYCFNNNDNLKIINETYRLIKPEGEMLLDICDPDYAYKNFNPFSQHDANNDISVFRKRTLDNNKIITKENVVSKSKGFIREEIYCETIFSEDEIKNIVTNAGFKSVEIKRNYSSHTESNDYGFMTSRMIVKCKKC